MSAVSEHAVAFRCVLLKFANLKICSVTELRSYPNLGATHQPRSLAFKPSITQLLYSQLGIIQLVSANPWEHCICHSALLVWSAGCSCSSSQSTPVGSHISKPDQDPVHQVQRPTVLPSMHHINRCFATSTQAIVLGMQSLSTCF